MNTHAPYVQHRPGHEGHVIMWDADSFDVLYRSCFFPDGRSLCGDADIYGKVTPERAAAVRRAAGAYWRESRRARRGTIGGRLRREAGLAR